MKIMTVKYIALAGIVALTFSGNVMADHNSPHGSGWANMPNDIHNTVIEDGLSGSEFRDFVFRGAGADSINRYADGTNGHSHSTRNGGSANRGGSRRGGRR